MGKTKRVNLWLVLVMTLLAVFSCSFGAVALKGGHFVAASAADFVETLGLEDRSWGAAEDEYYFGVMNNDAYLNTASAINGVWNSSSQTASLKPANNGVDIMQYIYVNGESARAASDTNKATGAYKGSSGWLANGNNYAPVFVETTDDSGIVIKMLKAYAGDTVTITFKEGFSVVDSSNTTLTLTKDVSFKYENGTLSKVEEVSSVAMDDKITISTWGAAEDGITWIHVALNGFTVAGGDWHNASDSKITANNGVDPLDFTYINGKPAREIYNSNNSALTVITATGWAEAYVVKVSTSYLALGDFTIQLKAGFTLVGADGKIYELKNDTDVYGWTNGNFGVWVEPEKPETLDDKVVISSWGAAEDGITWIEGALSFVPVAADWDKNPTDKIAANNNVNPCDYVLINGKTATELNAQASGTVKVRCYNWGENSYHFAIKVSTAYAAAGTFTVQYKAGLTLTGADGTLYVLQNDTAVYGWTNGNFGVWVEPEKPETLDDKVVISSWGEAETGITWIEGELSFVPVAVDWDKATAAQIEANNNVNPCDYVLINGKTATELNAQKSGTAKVRCYNWGENSYHFAIKVSTAYAAAGDFTVQYKAGLTLTGADGTLYELQNDTALYGWTNGDFGAIYQYTLTFEGVDYSKTILSGREIGELPEVPEKEGFVALGWAIDGKVISASDLYNYGADKTAKPVYETTYTMSFEGLSDTLTLVSGMQIGDLPVVPDKDGYIALGWTIDGVLITAETIYNYSEDKTAIASYAKDITGTINVDCQPGFAGAATEVVFVLQVEGGYLKTDASVSGVWNFGYDPYQAANGGVDILEYICINGETVRSAVKKNNSGVTSYKGDAGWLANGGSCAPVFVETAGESGVFIRIYTGYSNEYFTITFKAGFSLINTEGEKVVVTKDVTYKYIMGTVNKGEISDADLDNLLGETITLMDGNAVYLEKSARQLTLPALDNEGVEEGLDQVFIGWTTDINTLSNLYPAGYKLRPSQATTLYAVWIGFEMQEGAAVRLTAGSEGIRFMTDINSASYINYCNLGIIQGIGTLLSAENLVAQLDSFVHASFPSNVYYTDLGFYGNDMGTMLWKTSYLDNAIATYTAVPTNCSELQYARRLSARGYLYISYRGENGYEECAYVYTSYNSEDNARSMYEVATKAYKDSTKPQYASNAAIKNYVNKVVDLVWDDFEFAKNPEAVGNYTISDITIDEKTRTVTVYVDGAFKSALINGGRLIEGNDVNVPVGAYIYNFSNFTVVDGGFTFIIGAANDTYDKASDETLYFESSDEDLNFFLNDFFKRHSGYTEEGVNLKVNSVTAGVNSEEFFSHEWMSMSYYWYNSFDGYAEDRIDGLRSFLSNIPVDDYGYVWSSYDKVLKNYSAYDSTEQRMGWPIPHSGTLKTAHWDFNGSGDSGSWSSNIGAIVSGGLYSANVSGQSSNITFTSNSFNSLSSTKSYTYRAPLLEMDIRIDDASSVQDIYVWYTTSESGSFSEDKKVSVKDKAFISYDFNGKYEHLIFLPMYAETAWGASTSTYVKQIKVEIVLKSGATMSGNVGLNSVRLVADTRQTNNNSILISSLRTDYDYTGDLTYLANNITRARKAMNFLMQMYDASRKLNKQSYLVGHDGDKSGLSAVEKTDGSLSNGYWDVWFMPEYDFQSNMYFYKALVDMAYLEGILAENGITVDKSLATIKTATRAHVYSESAYTYTANGLQATANDVVNAMRATTSNNGFWNASTGRFAAGFDKSGNLYDYGYVAWNLEAIYYGVATDAQATSIMNWLNSETDLYEYDFAPVSNTVANKNILNGQWVNAKWSYGDNVQYGGATMYTSFYDLMARIAYNGADDAYVRLQAIEAWYMEIYNYYMSVDNADPNDFYRYYYEAKGIQLQGSGTNGGLGLDAEFLEAYLPLSAVAYGFFGLDSIDGKTLQINPSLPTGLTSWGMENLAFNKVKYDLTVYKNGIQINNVRAENGASTEGVYLQIVLDYTSGQKVYVNGVETKNYTVENGKVYLTVAMGATIVEVR